jgi:hypothetical protein
MPEYRYRNGARIVDPDRTYYETMGLFPRPEGNGRSRRCAAFRD